MLIQPFSAYRSYVQRYLDKQLQQPACGCLVEFEWRFLHDYWPESGHVISIVACPRHSREQASREMVPVTFRWHALKILEAAKAEGEPPMLRAITDG